MKNVFKILFIILGIILIVIIGYIIFKNFGAGNFNQNVDVIKDNVTSGIPFFPKA